MVPNVHQTKKTTHNNIIIHNINKNSVNIIESASTRNVKNTSKFPIVPIGANGVSLHRLSIPSRVFS